MNVLKLEDRLFEVVASRMVDADRIQEDLSYLHNAGILTFGDQTTRLLFDEFTSRGHTIELTDLCLEDDRSIGLQMPETSYLNCGLYALSISMYFNYLNYKEMAKAGVLYSMNASAVEEFGRIAAVEVYFQYDLQQLLDRKGSRYFGTPRTLTECMRVLEGWDLDKIPRLGRYVTYANFIKLWCSIHFPRYREAEWGIGKEESRAILRQQGTTNVREGIQYFWQNYLESRKQKIALEDVEVDILDPEFPRMREPRYILLGEDVFAEKTLDTGFEMVFSSFSESKIIRCPRNISASNDKQLKTARLFLDRFPSATVIMFRNSSTMPSFTMTKYDEVKEGVSRETAIVASGLRYVHLMEEGVDVRKIARTNRKRRGSRCPR